MNKEITIGYVPSVSPKGVNETFYRVTTELKAGQDTTIDLVTPYLRPFPVFVAQVDDVDTKVWIRSVAGSVVTLQLSGAPGPVTVFMRCIEEPNLTRRK
jgi:hypothetical protein